MRPAPATAAAHVRADQRHAWRGPSLLITDLRVECGRDPLSGYYFREARHLSRLTLLINGVEPWLCADASVSHHEIAGAYVYPELTTFGGGGTDASDDSQTRDPRGVLHRSIDVRMVHRLDLSRLVTAITLTNRSTEWVELALAVIVDADFADIQEAAPEGARQQEAAVDCLPRPSGLLYRYRHPELPLATDIAASGPTPWSASPHRLETTLPLGAQESATLTLFVTPDDVARGVFDPADTRARLERLARWRADLTKVEAPGANELVRMIADALDDVGSLALLEGAPDEWLALQAGIPLYPALFGRDTITAGWQMAMFDRGAVIDASLTRLGRMQSDRDRDWSDEEPGRIPYQVRTGPLARLRINPYAAYYADQASPLLFVIGLAHMYAWAGDKAQLARHWDAARRVLDWARERGDRDGDGYLEYLTKSPKGTKNQGWKDSGNAILYEDGTPVPAPLGTCDLQGYWYAAQQLMAGLSLVMGERHTAKDFWRSAAELKERFNRDWWVEGEGFFALALDADKRQVKSVTSNPGQCVATGIVDDAHLPRVVGRLFAPDLFSGWGVRTLSTLHPAYNPVGYHVGSVWPVENATICFGLRRFGFDQRALDVAGAYFDLARLYERGRIPECVGGYARAESPQPGAYPRANPLQLWNQSGYGLLLQSILGLQPLAPLHTLIVDPVLPAWMPELVLRDLRLGRARATVRFWRTGGGASHAEIVEKSGPFHLVRQPPVESLSAGLGDRFGALLETLLHH